MDEVEQMTAPRFVQFRNLEHLCADCGRPINDAEHRDPDARDNVTGAPTCRCRRPPRGPR